MLSDTQNNTVWGMCVHRTKVSRRETGRLPYVSSNNRLRKGQLDSGGQLGQDDALFYINAELKDQKIVRQTMNSEQCSGIESNASQTLCIY